MATWAILSELQRRGVAAGHGRGKGMHGYVVLGSLDGWGLGALTPDQATDQIFPAAQVRSGAGHNQATRDAIRASAAAGLMVNAQGSPAYIPGTAQCSATGQSGNVKLAQVSGQLALTGINTAAALSTSVAAALGGAVVLGAATLGIGAIIGLFPLLFGHHAAAVKKEQSVLCAAVPAANNYLAIIDQAVQEGKATPQQAIQALASLVSDFQSQVSSIIHGSNPMSSGECNAACVMLSELRAIVLVKQSAYQDLAAQQQPMTAGSGPTSASPASGSTLQIPQVTTGATPNWLPIAALIALGFIASRLV